MIYAIIGLIILAAIGIVFGLRNAAKLVLILAGIVVVVIAGFIIYVLNLNHHDNTPTNASVSATNSTHIPSAYADDAVLQQLCQKGAYTAPSQDEISYNQSIGEDPYVQYVRTAIKDFISNTYATGGQYSGFIDGAHYPDSAYGQLAATDKIYLHSKFIVLSEDTAPGGGKMVWLVFKNKPDKVFYAWVYDYKGRQYS